MSKSFSKFDLILLGAFVLIVLSFFAEFVLTWRGLPGLGQGYWSFVTIVCTGEIVTFSLYRVAKQGGVKQVATNLFHNNELVQLEAEEESHEGKTDES